MRRLLCLATASACCRHGTGFVRPGIVEFSTVRRRPRQLLKLLRAENRSALVRLRCLPVPRIRSQSLIPNGTSLSAIRSVHKVGLCCFASYRSSCECVGVRDHRTTASGPDPRPGRCDQDLGGGLSATDIRPIPWSSSRQLDPDPSILLPSQSHTRFGKTERVRHDALCRFLRDWLQARGRKVHFDQPLARLAAARDPEAPPLKKSRRVDLIAIDPTASKGTHHTPPPSHRIRLLLLIQCALERRHAHSRSLPHFWGHAFISTALNT